MNKQRFLTFLAAGLFASFLVLPAFAQSNETAPAVVSNQTNIATEEAPAPAPEKLVTAIEVVGNKAISTNVIVSKMKSRIGAPYQETVVSDDLKRLYLLGFFNDINIDTEEYKDGIKLIVSLSERPIIEKVSFEGIMRLTMKDEKLKSLLKSKEGQYLDYPSLAEDIKILQKQYEKIGYSQVAIDYTADINKETNKASVVYHVAEGKKVRIKEINFSGNAAFKSGRLLKVIKTRYAWFFNAGVLNDETLADDDERLKAFYERAGYADVKVSHEVKSDPKKPYLLFVNFTIDEGKKYLVGNITVNGYHDISLKEILSRLKDCTPGKVYSQEALHNDVNNIQALYFDRGYISVQINEMTALNPETSRIDIAYDIVENSIVYVNKVRIEGNVKTKDVVVRRELRLHPGERFDGDKLKRSKERLQNLGFFEEVSYDTKDTDSPDKKDLVVEVKEAKTGTFSFGGGYSTVDQLVGFAEIEQKNFDWKNFPYFTGDGQDLKFRASFGSISNGFDLSFTEPWMFDYPISFGFDAYMRRQKRDTDVGYGYDQDVNGGDLRLGKEISEFVKADLMYRFDMIKIGNINGDATNDLRQEEGSNVISSATLGLSFDNRDNVFDTTKGNLVSGSMELAGGPFGGDKDFWKFFGRASHYFPLWRGSSLEFRGRVGLADSYDDTVRIPIYERYFAGGANTIRGYEERKVGPVDPVTKDPLGGNALLIGNIEYTYPLLSFLKVAAFYDVGNVWEKMSDLGSTHNAFGVPNSGGFKNSVGLGVRIKTPIGPIMLDYGIPFNKAAGEEDKSSGRLHFSVSHGF